MKARKVRGLEPDEGFAENARRIVRVRLDELVAFAPAARDPTAVDVLHDMRIAAKRLRYVLELTTPVFGSPASDGAKQARKLQDLLGEVHDCDEMLPLVDRQLERLRAGDVAAVRSRAGELAKDVDPEAVRHAPNRRHYRGLEALRTYLSSRRNLLYTRFVREWSQLEEDRFAERLIDALGA